MVTKAGPRGFDSPPSLRFLTLDCQRLLFFICQHSPTHDDQSYTLVPQAKTWEEARQYCTETFYSLAAPEDQDKWKPAVLHSDMPVWIGLHREGGAALQGTENHRWGVDE